MWFQFFSKNYTKRLFFSIFTPYWSTRLCFICKYIRTLNSVIIKTTSMYFKLQYFIKNFKTFVRYVMDLATQMMTTCQPSNMLLIIMSSFESNKSMWKNHYDELQEYTPHIVYGKFIAACMHIKNINYTYGHLLKLQIKLFPLNYDYKYNILCK
jgi:hypothetical protein